MDFHVRTVEGQEFDMTFDGADAAHGIWVRWAPDGEWGPTPLQSGAYWTERRAAQAVLEYVDGDDTTDRVMSCTEIEGE